MALNTQLRNRALQVIIEFLLPARPILVSDVAGVAAHVECGVTAAFLWNVRAFRVARQAKVVVFARPGRGLDQLIDIRRRMWIVALDAITCGSRVNRLSIDRCLIVVTGKAQRGVRVFDQLAPRDVLVDTNFVTGEASHRDRRVNMLALGLCLMTFQALRVFHAFLEWNRMLGGQSRPH